MSLKRKARTLCARLSHGMGAIVSPAALAAILACSTQAQNEDTLGKWVTAPGDWDALNMVAMHAANLHTGKVLVWFAGNSARLWDPATGDFTDVPTTLPIHCSGHASLADGSILVAGGQDQGSATDRTAIFLLSLTGPWQEVADMEFARWYPTCTTLPDGTVLTVAGSHLVQQGCPQCIPEIYDPDQGQQGQGAWAVLAVEIHSIPRWYPFMFVAPDGNKVFFGGGGRGGCGDQCGNCEPQQSPCGRYTYMLDVDLETWTEYPVGNNDSFFTASRGSAVMYEPGKVLKSGGGTPVPVNSTALIDLNEITPQWELVPLGMTQPRRNHNLLLLPDGKVLALGGEREETPGLGNIIAVYAAEWFDPVLETWLPPLAAMTIARANHSTAVLLPNGKVLAAGGDADIYPNPDSAEIFEPPYLFVAGGGDAPRSKIGLAPTVITYGLPFKVILSSGSPVEAAEIDKVSLLRLASVTHSFDQNQRYVPLAFDVHDTLELMVQAPANANDAPPGYYMLFLVSDDGVPSVATYVRLE